jgi:hypothetical protein
MKKKVLFMIINMNIGGTEKALLNMINEMPNDKYEIINMASFFSMKFSYYLFVFIQSLEIE